MSDDAPRQSAPLQFDQAEYTAPVEAAACAVCQTPLIDRYWDVGGKTTCERCSAAAKAEWDALKPSFTSALLRGLVGAGGGAAIWITITMLTGYEIGLVAIIVGAIVGASVKKGSAGRGGRRFQLLAVALTYLAITSTYVPQVWKGLAQAAKKDQNGEATPAAAAPAPATGPTAAQPAAAAPAPDAGAAAAAEPAMNPLLAVALLAVIILLISLAGPFLGGFENILGILITGFALWEAWRINRSVELKVHGPFQLAQAPTAPEPAPAPTSAPP